MGMTGTRFKEKPIRLTVRFCDESELTPEEKARMESARLHLDRRVSELLADLAGKARTVPAEAAR